ncbi:hypothetical protein [Desulfopila sp. IMCC35008]|uniref:hypothetical protein n=1 Tax=Desulfopila sp. IMCC35008 TaxID=2653858 RepID=UPI0013D5C469|nr:hypothetical protein [Desulfopila sp. IMCC35008]
MTDNDNFVKSIEHQMQKRHEEVVKFRVIAEVADPDDQIEYYQIIEDIMAKDTAVREKLITYTESDDVDRSSLKNEIEALHQLLRGAIESAQIRIN